MGGGYVVSMYSLSVVKTGLKPSELCLHGCSITGMSTVPENMYARLIVTWKVSYNTFYSGVV